MFGKSNAEQVEKGFLFLGRFGYAAQADFMTVGGGKNDIGTMQTGK